MINMLVQVGVDNIREHMAQHSAATEDFNRRKLSLASQVPLLLLPHQCPSYMAQNPFSMYRRRGADSEHKLLSTLCADRLGRGEGLC